MELTREVFLRNTDHALVKPTLTLDDLRAGLEFVAESGCGVAVAPNRLGVVKAFLAGSSSRVTTMISHATGGASTKAKAAEAELYASDGADALDMVIDIGAMLSGEDALVHDDIAAVVAAAGTVPVGAILEVGYLNDSQIVSAAKLATAAGAAYVVTGTGFVPGGSDSHGVALLREATGPDVHVKAAGGLVTLEDVWEALNAGADRFGISRTQRILAEFVV